MKKDRSIRMVCSIVGFAGCLLVQSPSQAAEVAKSPYGPTDEIGVLNTLTGATSLAVLQRVDQGKVYDLSVTDFVGMPGLPDLLVGMGDPPFHMWMPHTPSGLKAEGLLPVESQGETALYDDAFLTPPIMGTHIDALNHFGYGDKIFNGYTTSQHLGDKGWTKAGADTIPPIITRGILIDVASEKRLGMLPDSYEISSADLQWALTKQSIALQPGDAVLIRTGRMTVWPDPKNFVPNEPGITRESAAWLVDNGAILIGADNMGVEKFPNATASVHTYLLAERGVCLVESLWLEELAKEGVYEFAFIAAPIKLRGATGAPIRPLALPIRALPPSE